MRIALSWGNAYPDFWLPDTKMVVEIDGLHHGKEYKASKDQWRTDLMLRTSKVKRVYRLWNHEVNLAEQSERVREVLRVAKSVELVGTIDWFCRECRRDGLVSGP